MQVRIFDSRYAERILPIVPVALFIASILFIFGPATIYYGNRNEFAVSFIHILFYYVPAFFALLMALVLASAFLAKRKYRQIYGALLFSVAIYLWTEGNLLVWNYGLLDGKRIDWQNYRLQGWIEVGFALLLFAVTVFFYRKMAKIGTRASLIMIVLQCIYLAIYIPSHSSFLQAAKASSGTFQSILDYSPSNNIIHIVLDGMQTDVFRKVVNANHMADDFDGFTLFAENIAAAGSTTFSIPSVFSGEAYLGKETLSSYVKKVFAKEAFTNKLYDAGYKVDMVPGIHIPVQKVTNYYMIPITYGSKRNDELGEACYLMDLVLFRHLPQFLKKRIYNQQKWIIVGLVSSNHIGHYRDKDFFKDYIASMRLGKDVPTYHYIHLMPPHPPWVTRSDCSCAENVLPQTKANYEIEVKCVLRLFFNFLAKLKKMGIYDSSFIVVQGDHGWGFPVKMKSTSNPEVSPSTVGRTLALLAVKPANSRGPIKISQAETSLTDIAATILDAAGLTGSKRGRPVFSIEKGEVRKRTFATTLVLEGSPYDPRAWKVRQIQDLPKRAQVETYHWGKTIEFGFTGNSEGYLKDGWSAPEDGFTWTNATRASLVIPLIKPHFPFLLEMNFRPLIVENKLDSQTVHILINGHRIGMWKLTEGGFATHSIIVPQKVVNSSDLLNIELELPNATRSLRDLGVGRDKRQLGIAVKSLQLDRLTNHLGKDINFGISGNAQVFQRSGWSYPEDGYTWTNGTEAKLELPIHKQPDSTVTLQAVLEPFLGKNLRHSQVLGVSVDGHRAASLDLTSPGAKEVSLVLPAHLFTQGSIVDLTFSIPRATSPKHEGLGEDSRQLGVAFHSIRLTVDDKKG